VGDAVVLYAAGVGLFLAVFWEPAYFPEQPWGLPAGRLPPWRSRRVIGAGALLLGAAVFAGLAWRGFEATHPYSATTWQQHLASVLLALAAAVVFDLRPWKTRRLAAGLPGSGLPGSGLPGSGLPGSLALAAILLLAFFLRVVRLDSLPFGVWYDEAEYGLQALRILNDPNFRPVFEGAINGPAHYLYLVAGAFDWVGVSATAIRLVNALFGVLAVGAGYVVGRELFDRRTGLALAFLLAVSSWLITLSRLGMHSTSTTPFFTLVTLAFLLRALRTGRQSEFALAGLGLGLGLCFYTSFRLFVPVVGLFLLYSAVCHWWRTRTLPPPRFWLGVAVLGIVALLVVLPLVWFARAQPEIFWSRVEDTFLFAGKTEAEKLPALLDNIQKHLLMFNWRGDPNGRHNLPGAPMLDTVAAALLILGVAYSLRRLRDPRYALLPLWLGMTLLGGILSLDFEAPQSLRANGTLGAAYVLAVVPLAVLAKSWRVGGGRYFPNAVWWPVAALLAVAGFANINRYYVAQANDFSAWAAHSAAETLTAQLLADLDPNTDAYVTSFYNGHPTLRFLLPTSAPHATLETTDQLPLSFVPGRGALLIMNPESHAQYTAAQRLYPNATFTEVMPPMPGPPVLYTVRLSPDDVASIQGLDGSYYANANWEGQPAFVVRDPALDFDWEGRPPLPLPFSVEWHGVLRAGTHGTYDFVLQSPAAAELAIGGQTVLSGTGVLSGSLTLAQGNHALRVRAEGAPGLLQLRWRTADRPLEVVGPGALYGPPLTANGLLARYFPNGDWQEPEAQARIEDQLGYYIHVPPLPRPYSVEYTGKIAIPAPGDYRFGLESIDESSLYIDEREIVRATAPNQYEEGSAALEAGLHDIRIRFADRTDHTHLNVYWMPPGAARAIIPPAVLFPPQGSYADITLPDLDSVVAQAPLPGSDQPAPDLPGTAVVFAEGLLEPRGVAVGADGRVYVADRGGKVLVFAPDGVLVSRLPGDTGVFAEPADVTITAANGVEQLFVLDAGAAKLWQFALDGGDTSGEASGDTSGTASGTDSPLAAPIQAGPEPQPASPLPAPAQLPPGTQPESPMTLPTEPPGEIPADPAVLDRSRGLAAGPDGRVWVAATPAGMLAGINPRDGADERLPLLVDGAGGQPVDVAVAADGYVYATDVSAYKLLRLTPLGRLERSWPIPRANSLDGPHLAFDVFGNLYVTDPEGGRVERRDPSGQLLGAWNVAGMLNQPVKAVGLAVGPDGRIWLTDSAGGRVIVIEPE
jgi:4-amino-4-deoxy-L-arabinose transferase-like glycosyltransferase/sugar lactone lactonase YvrE